MGYVLRDCDNVKLLRRVTCSSLWFLRRPTLNPNGLWAFEQHVFISREGDKVWRRHAGVHSTPPPRPHLTTEPSGTRHGAEQLSASYSAANPEEGRMGYCV